ncbi:MAG: hypothetical protein HY292_17445 [Planctomycetes bacterium]|nr:hypothetical protein [Planctomycetota bacterium]
MRSRSVLAAVVVSFAIHGGIAGADGGASSAPSGIHEIYLASAQSIVCLGPDLEVACKIELDGPCSHVSLVPPGHRLAAVIHVIGADGESSIAKLLSIDVASRKVETVSTIEDVAMTKSGPSPLVVSDAAPDQVGIVRRKFLPPDPDGHPNPTCSLEWVDLATVAHRTFRIEDQNVDVRVHALPSGALRATSYSNENNLWTLDFGGRVLWKVSRSPFASGRPGDSFVERGFEIDGGRNVALAFGRNGERLEISLADGAVHASRVPVENLGAKRFIEKVRRSEAARAWALGVVGEDPVHNDISSVRLFDESWKEIGRVSGACVWNFAFSPDGAEVVTLGIDGTIGRYSVPDGRLVASKNYTPPLSSEIVGIR